MTRPLDTFDDIHAHTRRGPRIITSVEPDSDIDTPYGEAWYSVGVHPWSTSEPVSRWTLDRLARMCADPRVVAIGEAGFDRRRGGSPEYQDEIFLPHVKLSESLRKPLVIHCVGRYGHLMELHGALRPSQLWIVHGFTGKPELARQLTSQGIALSIGSRRAYDMTELPAGLVYRESDA